MRYEIEEISVLYRALDEMGSFDFSIQGEAMRPYLNPYGRRLLLGEGAAPEPVVHDSGQLFKGTVNGSLPVTLFLGARSNLGDTPFEEAHYYYDKYRKKIGLDLKRQGDVFTLTEQGKDGKPGAVMTLKLSGERLTGDWRAGAKRLPVELKAY